MAATKTHIVVGAAILAVVGSGGVMLYKSTKAPSPTPTSIVSTKIQAASNVEPIPWKPMFDAVYTLQPGQHVLRVIPPFIPERDDYFHFTFTPKPGSPRPTSASMILAYDREHLKLEGTSDRPLTLGWILTGIVGVQPNETDLPSSLLNKQIPGDWVTRDGSTREERMADVSASIDEFVANGKTMRQEPLQRQVIVARGEFRYVPIPARGLEDRTIYFYRSNLGPAQPVQRNASPVDLPRLLKALGNQLNIPVVVEAKLEARANFFWQADMSADFSQKPDDAPTDLQAIKEILANVSQQTSLTFTMETRSMPTCRLVSAVHQ